MRQCPRVGTIPLAALLCVQAVLLLAVPGLLPLWGDELFTVRTVVQPFGPLVRTLANDIHPPLYFLLLHEWAKLPLPWTGIGALRVFSGLWGLAATLLLDRFWIRNWEQPARWTALALFAFSPCLLLYGRMARSYSMQAALVLVAVAAFERWGPQSAVGCTGPRRLGGPSVPPLYPLRPRNRPPRGPNPGRLAKTGGHPHFRIPAGNRSRLRSLDPSFGGRARQMESPQGLLGSLHTLGERAVRTGRQARIRRRLVRHRGIVRGTLSAAGSGLLGVRDTGPAEQGVGPGNVVAGSQRSCGLHWGCPLGELSVPSGAPAVAASVPRACGRGRDRADLPSGGAQRHPRSDRGIVPQFPHPVLPSRELPQPGICGAAQPDRGNDQCLGAAPTT